MSNLSQKKGYKSHLVKKAAVALTVFTMASAGVVAIDSAHSEDVYAATALKKTSVKKFGNLKKGYTVYTGITLTKKAGTTDAHTAKTLYVQYSFQKNGKTYYRVLQNKKHFGVVEAAAFKQAGNGLNYFGAKNVISNRQVQITAKDSIYSNLNSLKVAGSTEDHIGEMTVSNGYFNHYNGQRYYALYQDGKLFGYVNTKALKANATDLTALNAAIKAADELKAEDYTKASFEAFAKVLDEAKATAKKVGVNKADADAAVKALDDATKALVKELRVESVSAISANKVKATFNGDASKGTFELKKGTVVIDTTLEVSEDGKTVTFTKASGDFIAGDYTVVAKGLGEQDLTATVKVEDQKVAAIEVAGDAIKANDGLSATVQYKALNQYGDDYTKKASLNLAVSDGVTNSMDSAKGLITLTSDFRPTNPAALKSVVVTLVDPTTGVSKSQTVKIADAVTIKEFALGDVTLPEKATRIYSSEDEAAKIAFTAKDQYGNIIKNPGSSVQLLSSNPSLASFTFVKNADDSYSINVKTGSLPTAQAQNVVLSAVNVSTGEVFTKTIKVEAPAAPATVELGSFNKDTLAIGDTVYLDITVKDQYGEVLAPKDYVNYVGLNFTGSIANGLVTKVNDKYDKNYGKVKLDLTGVTKGTGLLTGSVGTTVVTKQYTVSDARVLTEIVAPSATTLVQGANTKLGFKFYDQYGEVIKAAADTADLEYKVTVEKVSGDDAGLTVDKSTANTESDLNSITATSVAGKSGTYSVTVDLIKTSTSKVVSSAKATVKTVADNVEGLTYSVKPLDSLVFGGSNAVDGTNPYAQVIEIEGKDANGNKLVINPSQVIGVTLVGTDGPGGEAVTDNVAVTVAGSPVGTEIPSLSAIIDAQEGQYVIAAKKAATKDTPTDIKVRVTLNTADGLKVIDTPVTVSAETPKVQEVIIANEKVSLNDPTKLTSTAKIVDELVYADVDALVSGTTLAGESLTKAYVITVDQFGIYSNPTASSKTNLELNSTSLMNLNSHNVQADEADGLVKLDNKTGVEFAAGKKIRFSVLINGKTASLDITIKAETPVAAAPVSTGTWTKGTLLAAEADNAVITFSEAISAESKTAVENAIKAGVAGVPSANLKFVWSRTGNATVVTVTNTHATISATFAADATVSNVKDLYGNNTATVTLDLK